MALDTSRRRNQLRQAVLDSVDCEFLRLPTPSHSIH